MPASPLVSSNVQFAIANQTGMMTTLQPERKHFKRTRVNTKTPSAKQTTVVLSADGMQWDYARKLIDSFETIVAAD